MVVQIDRTAESVCNVYYLLTEFCPKTVSACTRLLLVPCALRLMCLLPAHVIRLCYGRLMQVFAALEQVVKKKDSLPEREIMNIFTSALAAVR